MEELRNCSTPLTVRELADLVIERFIPSDAFVTFRIEGINELVKKVSLTERDPETGDIDLVLEG